jgi:pyruvate ferredoxin oxidoreductase alpha subunit
MTRELLTGNAAAAWAARLAGVDYLPVFPITPQTEVIETLGRWIDAGELDARMVTLDSEHSMITAAGTAALSGARVFTATSSQGLLYGMEMIYTVSGWRAPFVLANVSRGLATPITLEPDHNDVLAARDSGFLQIHCATCQEIVDCTLIAFRVAEDPRVRLPVLVNYDGFYLSFTREPVDLPTPAEVDAFLPAYDAGALGIRGGRPHSEAVSVLGGSPYSYFRYETHVAAQQALAVYDEVAAAYEEECGRAHPAVESYHMDDAEVAFVMIGSFATKAEAAVDELRAEGQRVGLVRPRLLRPFPQAALRGALLGRRAVVVVDQNLSMGKGGVLHTELASALYGARGAPPLLGFVGGLGGRDISAAEFRGMASLAARAAETGEVPEVRLLYTGHELLEMRKLQAIAAVHAEEGGEP